MKILIVTHPPPHHIDDYLAVSLLLHKWCDILKKHNVTLKFARNASDVENVLRSEQYDLAFVIDVGGKYGVEGRVRYYDHHHDANLPCSLILVLKHEFPEIYEKAVKVPILKKLLEYIDARDRFGPFKAAEMLGITDPHGVLRYLPNILISSPSKELGQKFLQFLQSYATAAENTDVVKVGEVSVAIYRGDPKAVFPGTIFDVTNADIVIMPNIRNPQQTSIYRNDVSPIKERIELSNVGKLFKIAFLHPNKFLAVVDAGLSDVAARLKELVDAVLQK